MRLLLFSFLLSLGTLQLSAQSPDPRIHMDAFLRDAVEHGLKMDAFPRDLAVALSENRELWVGKCPICMPVEQGFRKYATNFHPSVKRRVSAKTIAVLKGEDVVAAKGALQKLVTKYTRKYYKVLGMDKAQRAAMVDKLVQGREQGMNRANGGEDFFCASCDGACSIKPKKKKKQ